MKSGLWLLGAASATALSAGGEDERFMPKGGRTLLIEALGPGAGVAALRPVLAARKTEAEWTLLLEAVKSQDVDLFQVQLSAQNETTGWIHTRTLMMEQGN